MYYCESVGVMQMTRYQKLRVRVVSGGFRLKFCNDPFTDVYLMSIQVSGRTLKSALILMYLDYQGGVDATSHKGLGLQGKYDRHHRLQKRDKMKNIYSCMNLLP